MYISTHNRSKESKEGEPSMRWRTALVVATNMPGKELSAAATHTTHMYICTSTSWWRRSGLALDMWHVRNVTLFTLLIFHIIFP